MENDNCVFISLDLEHGGDKCRVTQLSAVLFRLGGFDLSNTSISKDLMIREVFNEYVRPPKSAIWNPKYTEITRLYANHPSIINADRIDQVWSRFTSFIDKYISLKEQAVLVA